MPLPTTEGSAGRTGDDRWALKARYLGRRTSHNNDGFASEDQLIIVRHLQEALPRPDLRSSARPGTYTSAVRQINHLCVALGWFLTFYRTAWSDPMSSSKVKVWFLSSNSNVTTRLSYHQKRPPYRTHNLQTCDCSSHTGLVLNLVPRAEQASESLHLLLLMLRCTYASPPLHCTSCVFPPNQNATHFNGVWQRWRPESGCVFVVYISG